MSLVSCKPPPASKTPNPEHVLQVIYGDDILDEQFRMHYIEMS